MSESKGMHAFTQTCTLLHRPEACVQADQENRGMARSTFWKLLGILQRGLAWPQMKEQKSQLLLSLRRDSGPLRGGTDSGEQSAGFSERGNCALFQSYWQSGQGLGILNPVWLPSPFAVLPELRSLRNPLLLGKVTQRWRLFKGQVALWFWMRLGIADGPRPGCGGKFWRILWRQTSQTIEACRLTFKNNCPF